MKVILVLFTVFVLPKSGTSSDVEKAFIENDIVADIFVKAPKRIVNVTYPRGLSVNLGNELTPTEVKDKPIVSWDYDKHSHYTLAMLDPDATSRKNPDNREIRHWLVMNIPGSCVERGDEIIVYNGPVPKKHSGLHRYIFLIYKQPHGYIEHDNEPRSTNRYSTVNRLKTSVSDLAKRYNLGAPKFGNFFQAKYDSYVDIFNAINLLDGLDLH